MAWWGHLPGGDVGRDTETQKRLRVPVLANAGVIVIAATNFPESLDKALVRPGRFDRHVVVPNPDVKGRQQILEVHFKNIPRGPDVDLHVSRPAGGGWLAGWLAGLLVIVCWGGRIEGRWWLGKPGIARALQGSTVPCWPAWGGQGCDSWLVVARDYCVAVWCWPRQRAFTEWGANMVGEVKQGLLLVLADFADRSR